MLDFFLACVTTTRTLDHLLLPRLRESPRNVVKVIG